ncbi:hypothetical protein [Arthrobacter sp. SD76]|uniref:hypothetical protein n=1 Tax=Arthrobacter sp. SD76 TaxID=3415007 RepID=UPI003C720995
MDNGGKPTPVLEIGGTHVTAALVSSPGNREQQWAVVPDSVVRRGLDANASADTLLDGLAAAARDIGARHDGCWGVALPGPFDYANGVALYEHVGKFDQLRGVDIRAGLRSRLQDAMRSAWSLTTPTRSASARWPWVLPGTAAGPCASRWEQVWVRRSLPTVFR